MGGRWREGDGGRENAIILTLKVITISAKLLFEEISISMLLLSTQNIVSAARSLTCRDDLDSKWRLLLAENELSRVSLLSRISIEN